MNEISFPFSDPEAQKYIQIDEEGRWMIEGIRTTDEAFGGQLLNQIVKHEKGSIFAKVEATWACVEAFDEPYVAEQISKDKDGSWSILLPYGLTKKFDPKTLCLDEWDRFHGHAENEISFVLSRKAQSEFFDLVDEFDDDSITIDGSKIEMLPWLVDDNDRFDESFWSNIYLTEPNPGFDLGGPANGLKAFLPKLKLNKSRIAVLGSGKGHDAAHFAEAGHIVTGFDISPHGIKESRERYGHLEKLSFVEADIFNLPEEYFGQFDLVFEHTCYCAVKPSLRNELVKVWKRLLVEGGHVLGVFFAFDKRFGPPYGGSEWELRRRFTPHFQTIYWNRLQKEKTSRVGKEVLIYMEKKS